MANREKNYHTNAIPDSFWEDQVGFDEDIELEEDSYEKQNDTLWMRNFTLNRMRASAVSQNGYLEQKYSFYWINSF